MPTAEPMSEPSDAFADDAAAIEDVEHACACLADDESAGDGPLRAGAVTTAVPVAPEKTPIEAVEGDELAGVGDGERAAS